MTCYLDPLIPSNLKLGSTYHDSCILWADDEDDLIELAERAGIPLGWKRRSASGMAYFTLTKWYRARARAAGAVCLSEIESGRMHAALRPQKKVYKNLQKVR